jgi:hypothetical protein
MFTNKIVQYLATLVGMVIAIGTVYVAVDDHYAKAEEVREIKTRLEQKIIMDRTDRLQERVWKLEDRYPDKNKMPAEAQDNIRVMNREIRSNEMMLKQPIGAK